MPKLLVLCGPPGCGKTTVAKHYEGTYTWINQDSQGKAHMQIFQKALLENKNILVDRMNFSKEQRNRYLEPAKKAGYETEITVIHQPKKVCMERCINRKDHKTIKDEKSAAQALSLFFSKYERPTEDEADFVQFCYPQEESEKLTAIIFDLDGTLCNLDHRLHFLKKPEGEKKNWKGFLENLIGDKVNKWCADIINALSSEYTIVYCSGRPDDYRPDTMAWLEENDLYGHRYLFMRPRNDYREDSIVKEILLDFEVLTRFKPYFFIDDRQRVVDMYRKRGFTVLQCDKGDF